MEQERDEDEKNEDDDKQDYNFDLDIPEELENEEGDELNPFKKKDDKEDFGLSDYNFEDDFK